MSRKFKKVGVTTTIDDLLNFPEIKPINYRILGELIMLTCR